MNRNPVTKKLGHGSGRRSRTIATQERSSCTESDSDPAILPTMLNEREGLRYKEQVSQTFWRLCLKKSVN